MRIVFIYFLIVFFFEGLHGQTRYDSDPSSFFFPEELGKKAQLMASGLVSTGLDETGGAFSLDFHEFYFTVGHRNDFSAIVYIRYFGGVWRYPKVVEFSGRYRDADPFMAPCGTRLFFSSTRPIPETDAEGTWNIWYVERDGNSWGVPQYVPLNPERHERSPSVTSRGDLYFNADYGSSLVTYDFMNSNIYVSSRNFEEEVFNPGKLLSGNINSEFADYSPVISPDGSFLIFSSNRPGGFGNSDLYSVSRIENSKWGTSENLGELVNTSNIEHTPVLCPNGEYLFFSSNRRIYHPIVSGRLTYGYFKRMALGAGNGLNDIYFIGTSFLGID